jgi:hypothetical protein
MTGESFVNVFGINTQLNYLDAGFTHVPNKALLIPGSCRETERNGNSISSEVKNKYHNNYNLHAICLQLLLSGDIYVKIGVRKVRKRTSSAVPVFT